MQRKRERLQWTWLPGILSEIPTGTRSDGFPGFPMFPGCPNKLEGQRKVMVYLNDVEIIERCKQGDQEAFRELVRRYQEKVIWIAYQMVGNYEEARDISQEVFLRVYRSIQTFNLMSNFYTWIYRIAVNLCIDYHRKQKNSQRLVSFEEIGEVGARTSPADHYAEKKEISLEVEALLRELPPLYRTILLLRDIEGFSCKEISNIVGCNANTVRWRLFRARQLFKDLWEKAQEKHEPKALNGLSP